MGRLRVIRFLGERKRLEARGPTVGRDRIQQKTRGQVIGGGRRAGWALRPRGIALK
jgi:hypothetical protein